MLLYRDRDHDGFWWRGEVRIRKEGSTGNSKKKGKEKNRRRREGKGQIPIPIPIPISNSNFIFRHVVFGYLELTSFPRFFLTFIVIANVFVE